MDFSRYYRPPWLQQAGLLYISTRRILGNLSCVGWMTCSAVWRPLLLPGIYWEVIILLLAEVERGLWDAELSVICQMTTVKFSLYFLRTFYSALFLTFVSFLLPLCFWIYPSYLVLCVSRLNIVIEIVLLTTGLMFSLLKCI